ncbi:MAG TPA: hypothetical protein ENH00_09200 [Actinobacteria bacterium]|nr:hypothetical protein [Actinomycetota bacterium]
MNAVMRANGQGEIQDWPDRPWRRELVSIRELRFLHGEFRGVKVDKGRLFMKVAKEWSDRIVEGSLGLALKVNDDIRRGFTSPLELVVVRDRKRDLYVMDGCKRVLTACFHGQPDHLYAFVVDTDEGRELERF